MRRVKCPTCGTENEAGRKFCGECGTALAAACPRCGTVNAAGMKFCGECGLDLRRNAAPGGDEATATTAATAATPATERRLVSVLFVDLVGFTTASEERDAEDTRDFLGRYFDTSRTIIERYGGTVEKFIGDAVMAVWGAPTAHEDDAERAVRAALDLVSAVPSLDERSPARARAGVLTGEAAVTIGATNQGIVSGDLVNTASRLQSAAPPGSVYVGEGTYRAAAKAIGFEPVGELELKGKAAPVQAWRAISVTSLRGGERRSESLEPPFVGRDEELRLLKDLFHATEREHKARLVSVVGQGGIGKSRLAWELEKYLDGLVDTIFWHTGRSPAYGEGISYWALAEMVRERTGIAESDDEAASLAKLRQTLAELLPDAAERAWVEARLAGLLALGPMPSGSREELFAAWRVPFERLAEQGPTVLVFEDVQWADQGLLDFIEALLDDARNLPIFVVTLARPELFDSRPGWGSGVRSASTMQLEPLPADEVAAMIRGLVPRIPQDALAAIISRSEGIPLYAVETVRMLIDLGQLRRTTDGDHWELTGKVRDLAVPETLQALIASRLDALEPADRTLLQQAAVLGQSFTLPALAGVSGDSEEAVGERLAALVRRDLLLHETNPRSPERGQYQFVQGIVREVAHGLLSRADRRALHLAAARQFESLGDEELAGILASHYMAAHTATAAGPEADALAAQARIALRAAADRSVELHAWDAAIKHLEQAIEITTDPAELAVLEERAAQAAIPPNRYDLAAEHAMAAVARHRATGDRLGELRGQALRAEVEMSQHGDRTAIPILREALDAAADLPPSVEHGRAEAQLSRALMLQGAGSESIEHADRVLSSPAAAADEDLVLETLISKGAALQMVGRLAEADVVLRGAIEVADLGAKPNARMRARNNLLSIAVVDIRASLAIAAEAYDIAKRLGARGWQDQFSGVLLATSFEAGDIDAWLDEVGDHMAEATDFFRRWYLMETANRAALRGSIDEARSLIGEVTALLGTSSQASEAAAGSAGLVEFLAGDYGAAIERFESTWRGEQGSWTISWGVAAALMRGDVAVLHAIAALVPESQIAGRMVTCVEAAISAGLLALGEARLDRPGVPEDLRGSVIAVLAVADEIGVLLWRAVMAIILGSLAAGRFPEADAVADEGVQFLVARGAGALAERLRHEAGSLRTARGATHRTAAADAVTQ